MTKTHMNVLISWPKPRLFLKTNLGPHFVYYQKSIRVQERCLLPSHSESPYTGKWCTLWGRPDSLQYMTGFPASPLQHTSYSVSAPSPQTAVCQSEIRGNIKKDQKVKIVRQGTEPSGDLDASVRELSASVGIFMWKLVLVAPHRFLPFFPSPDKWGAVFSWTGHTSRDCWAIFPHWKHLLKLLGYLGQMHCECFHLTTDRTTRWKPDTAVTIQEGILMVSPSPVV